MYCFVCVCFVWVCVVGCSGWQSYKCDRFPVFSSSLGCVLGLHAVPFFGNWSLSLCHMGC